VCVNKNIDSSRAFRKRRRVSQLTECRKASAARALLWSTECRRDYRRRRHCSTPAAAVRLIPYLLKVGQSRCRGYWHRAPASRLPLAPRARLDCPSAAQRPPSKRTRTASGRASRTLTDHAKTNKENSENSDLNFLAYFVCNPTRMKKFRPRVFFI
jgi:hypothetical protein